MWKVMIKYLVYIVGVFGLSMYILLVLYAVMLAADLI